MKSYMEYIGSLSWYCLRLKPLGNIRALGQYIPVFNQYKWVIIDIVDFTCG